MIESNSLWNGPSIRIGVVGAGYWGKNHVRVFNELGVLTRVCDQDAIAIKNTISNCSGVQCSECFEDIVSDKSISGVVIATPAETHFDLAMQALEAGKDVLVEKPVALSQKDATRMLEYAERNGNILMVGHILLYHPAVLKLKEIIDNGELGKIQHVTSNRLSMGKVRSEENILWSFAPHDISMLLFLLGETPIEVNSIGYSHLQEGVEDVTVSTMRFAGGVGAHIYVSWMHPFKEHKLVVVGDRKMAVFEDSSPDNKLKIHDCSFKWLDRHPVPVKTSIDSIEIPSQEPLRMEALGFLEAITTRRPPRSDGREGLRTLSVLQQCYDSMKSRQPVRILPPADSAPVEKDFQVHETAVIDYPCRIGKGTRIWHFSHVMENAQIGSNCNIGQNVVVGSGVTIGNNCKIQNNVSVYEGVTLEDYVFCGPSMVFTNVYNPRCEIPRMKELRPTLVKRGATLGANCTIVCGHTIGEYAFVGAGAVVRSEVPNHALMLGNPARIAGWMCRCGNRVVVDNSMEGQFSCQTCGKQYFKNDFGLAEFTQEAIEETKVPLLDLKAQYASIRSDVTNAINRVMESQHFILGPEVEALEREIAEYCECAHAVGVSSGTDALLISLMTLGVSPGDEIITTPFTFFATMGAILRLGAKPVFVDIEPDSFNIDVNRIQNAVTPKTKIILPVHLFGQATDMGPLNEIAAKNGLAVIEDAAQAIGTEYEGKRTGGLGTLGCFSFFPSKNLGAAGDGGIVTTNSGELAAQLRIMRNHGAKPKYFHKTVGGNFRLDAIQAAILREKLKHLEDWTDKRRANAAFYSEKLSALNLTGDKIVTPPLVRERHIYNQYVIRAKNRDGLASFLKKSNVATEIYYPLPMHLQECVAYLGFKTGDFPNSEEAAKEVLALPIYPELSEQQKNHVVEAIKRFYE